PHSRPRTVPRGITALRTGAVPCTWAPRTPAPPTARAPAARAPRRAAAVAGARVRAVTVISGADTRGRHTAVTRPLATARKVRLTSLRTGPTRRGIHPM